MSWKGRHSRDWVRVTLDYYHNEYEIRYEEDASNYGVFGIVTDGYDDDDDNWYVIWRPNRNHTTEYYIKVMSNAVEMSWGGTRDEAIKYSSLGDAKASIAEHWQTNFKYPEKPKRYRPRDSQKGKLYRWEHIMARDLSSTVINDKGREVDALHQIHDHLYLRMFLTEVRQELNEKAVELRFRSGGRSSFGGISGIQLLPCHCHHLVLLHELAHVLHKRWMNTIGSEKHQSHGREFVGVFMYLLIRFGGVDKSEITRHANRYKIDFLLPTQYWEWEDSEIQEKVA